MIRITGKTVDGGQLRNQLLSQQQDAFPRTSAPPTQGWVPEFSRNNSIMQSYNHSAWQREEASTAHSVLRISSPSMFVMPQSRHEEPITQLRLSRRNAQTERFGSVTVQDSSTTGSVNLCPPMLEEQDREGQDSRNNITFPSQHLEREDPTVLVAVDNMISHHRATIVHVIPDFEDDQLESEQKSEDPVGGGPGSKRPVTDIRESDDDDDAELALESKRQCTRRL